MSISTNSIIHYTKRFDTLKSILKEGFRCKYCNEPVKFGKGSSKAAHPMVSFCDIPFSNIKEFQSYGQYGIGLTKKWAMKKGVNPVLYIDKNSLIAKTIYGLIRERRNEYTNLTPKQKLQILQIKSYIKNYMGDLNENSDYKFYNEREWRLVPPKDKIKQCSISVSSNKYLQDKSKYNNKISDYRCTFNHNDISYIIVEKTDEIPELVTFLRKEYKKIKKCTNNELDILLTKVCSMEQIKADN